MGRAPYLHCETQQTHELHTLRRVAEDPDSNPNRQRTAVPLSQGGLFAHIRAMTIQLTFQGLLDALAEVPHDAIVKLAGFGSP